MSTKPRVSIVMGSDSDLDIMRESAKALEEFGIEYEIDVTSAHRSPDRTAEFARKAASRGIRVIIAGAGGAAHLAGVIAAHTTLPVIGVPIPSTSLQGMDSLLATVQMPAGIPVATVAIGKPGATNAGILAAQILALSSAPLEKKLAAHKEKLANSVEEKSRKLKITVGASKSKKSKTDHGTAALGCSGAAPPPGRRDESSLTGELAPRTAEGGCPTLSEIQALQILPQRPAQIGALQRKFHRSFKEPQLVAGVVALAFKNVAVDFFFLQQLLQPVGKLQFATGAGLDVREGFKNCRSQNVASNDREV